MVYPPNSSSAPSPDSTTLTCLRASRATKNSGTSAGSATGSSRYQTISGSAATNSSGATTLAMWRGGGGARPAPPPAGPAPPAPSEAGGEGDQPRVVPNGQRCDRGRVDAAGQKRADGDVGAHVLGHRVLQDRGDLVIAGLLATIRDRRHLEARHEIAGGLRRLAWTDPRIAARFQPAHAPMQRLGFGHVLQHYVVLNGTIVDRGVESHQVGQFQQAFLLAGHGGATGPGGHEQRLDAERISGTEQFAGHGVP